MPGPAPTLPGSIGEFIRERREELGMTADDLAAKLGVHQTTVSRWERSRNLTRMRKYIDKLGQHLDTSPDVLWDLYMATLRNPNSPGLLNLFRYPDPVAA